jgi:hypothetical protein
MNLTLEIHHRETFEKETKLIYKAEDVQAYGHRYVIKFWNQVIPKWGEDQALEMG